MPYLHPFGTDDKFFNRMETHPDCEFQMYSGSIYFNNNKNIGVNIPDGFVSLFEYNVNRSSGLMYPYVIKDGSGLAFPNVTKSEYEDAQYGAKITGSYPLTSSLTRQYYAATPYPTTNAEWDIYVSNRKELIALQNTMNYYRTMSNHYHYTGSFVSGAVNMLQIPSIFYDTSIKKGSLSLKFYFTGSLIDEAKDLRQNGELISTMGGASGSVVGVALYNEGFIMLTSSVAISANQDDYGGTGTLDHPSWLYYGAYSQSSILGPGKGTFPSASLYDLSFQGTQKVPTMMMFATAQLGHVNNSLNPTWMSSSNGDWRERTSVSPLGYVEPRQLEIANTVQSQYCNFEDGFEKQVFISEIGIFDEDKNLIGVAKLANPVLKKESQDYTFKLKLDL